MTTTHGSTIGHKCVGKINQRIAISRALLRKSEIIIFDDSTSALDLRTEAKLYEALNSKYRNITKIIIAQRVASIRNADRIVVLDGGTISAIGTHEELLAGSDIYKDIYESQLKLSDDPKARALMEENTAGASVRSEGGDPS